MWERVTCFVTLILVGHAAPEYSNIETVIMTPRNGHQFSEQLTDGKLQVNFRVHKSRAIWHTDVAWCVDTDWNKLICTENRFPLYETNCGSHKHGELWLEFENSVHCMCSSAGALCVTDKENEHESDDVSAMEDFDFNLCNKSTAWYDGFKWCVCVYNPRYNRNDMYCVVQNTPYSTGSSHKQPCSKPNVSIQGDKLCACSGRWESCILPISLRADIHTTRYKFVKKRSRKRRLRRWIETSHVMSDEAVMETGCGGRSVGDRWADRCNTCICSNANVAMCTAKHCRPETPEFKTG